MQSNNVIDFNEVYLYRLSKEDAAIEEFEDLVDDIMEEIIVYAGDNGYIIENGYDLGLLCETIRSAMMRTVDKTHALQKVAEEIVELID